MTLMLTEDTFNILWQCMKLLRDHFHCEKRYINETELNWTQTEYV